MVLTGTAVIDLLEPTLDLDQPPDLAMFNAVHHETNRDEAIGALISWLGSAVPGT